MKTSPPRTFSNIWKLNSPSGKRVVFARPSSIPRYWQISSANKRWALPENICRLFTALYSHGWGGRIRTYEWRLQRPLPYHLATPQQTLTCCEKRLEQKILKRDARAVGGSERQI